MRKTIDRKCWGGILILDGLVEHFSTRKQWKAPGDNFIHRRPLLVRLTTIPIHQCLELVLGFHTFWPTSQICTGPRSSFIFALKEVLEKTTFPSRNYKQIPSRNHKQIPLFLAGGRLCFWAMIMESRIGKERTEWQLEEWQTKLKNSLLVIFLVNFGEQCSRFKSRCGFKNIKAAQKQAHLSQQEKELAGNSNFSNYALLFCQFLQIFFRSQIFCYWKGHPSSEITSLRSFALLYKHADAGTPSARISILSAQGSNMGNIQHLARMFPQNSGKADSYLDFSTHHLHSTYPPYAPKGQQNHREPSEQCTVCEPSFDTPWDKCATTQST